MEIKTGKHVFVQTVYIQCNIYCNGIYIYFRMYVLIFLSFMLLLLLCYVKHFNLFLIVEFEVFKQPLGLWRFMKAASPVIILI